MSLSNIFSWKIIAQFTTILRISGVYIPVFTGAVSHQYKWRRRKTKYILAVVNRRGAQRGAYITESHIWHNYNNYVIIKVSCVYLLPIAGFWLLLNFTYDNTFPRYIYTGGCAAARIGNDVTNQPPVPGSIRPPCKLNTPAVINY